MSEPLKAPFPWFGGKSRVADLVWERFGKVDNYVEPFFGSGAVLLGSPRVHRTETVNDLDGFISNFWRAIAHDPDATARHADWPVNENDLHARHAWLVSQKNELVPRLEGDPEYYDVKIAGWWVWGMACWIGGQFCSGKGPWQVVNRQLVHLGNAGKGVNRKLVHLGNAGRGMNRQRGILEWFHELSSRMKRVRVCCGDWSRVCGPSSTIIHGITGMFLDPPYGADAKRDENIYTHDSLAVADDVRKWAIEHGNERLIRIALCGYEGEHNMPDEWDCVAWKASCGYSERNTKNKNSSRERIWFSPHCESNIQLSLLDRPMGGEG